MIYSRGTFSINCCLVIGNLKFLDMKKDGSNALVEAAPVSFLLLLLYCMLNFCCSVLSKNVYSRLYSFIVHALAFLNQFAFLLHCKKKVMQPLH